MLDSAMNNLVNQVQAISRIFGASVGQGARYPGWKYSERSPLRDTMAAAVQALYDEELKVTATHGGCECGVFSQIHPDMDIISIGPVTRYIHTPDEELDLASFDRTYRLLTNVIAGCK
jgi:dipeptidase D